jgi:hypothetical protein
VSVPYRLMHVIPPAGPVYAAKTSGCRVASGIAGRLEKEIVTRKAWKVWQMYCRTAGNLKLSTRCTNAVILKDCGFNSQ